MTIANLGELWIKRPDCGRVGDRPPRRAIARLSSFLDQQEVLLLVEVGDRPAIDHRQTDRPVGSGIAIQVKLHHTVAAAAAKLEVALDNCVGVAQGQTLTPHDLSQIELVGANGEVGDRIYPIPDAGIYDQVVSGSGGDGVSTAQPNQRFAAVGACDHIPTTITPWAGVEDADGEPALAGTDVVCLAFDQAIGESFGTFCLVVLEDWDGQGGG
jgi:hypothetical protein